MSFGFLLSLHIRSQPFLQEALVGNGILETKVIAVGLSLLLESFQWVELKGIFKKNHELMC